MAKVDLAKLLVTLEAQNAKYLKKLEQSEKRGDRWEKRAKKNVAGVKKAFVQLGGVVGLSLLTRKIVRATKEQEQAVKQLEQGLASTGGVVGRSLEELTQKAADFQKATTFGDEEIIRGMSQLVTFTNIAGEQFDRTTQAALDLSVRMDQDLKSSIVQLGKALNDPIANLSALSRTGIQFSDQQKTMIKRLVESNRLMEAQDVILKELERQFGGSAAAARNTFGGALEGLGNAFNDLFEAGEGLDDAKQSVESMTNLLQDPEVIKGINNFTSALIDGFSEIIELAAKTGVAINNIKVLTNGDNADNLAEVFERVSRFDTQNLGGANSSQRVDFEKSLQKVKLFSSKASEEELEKFLDIAKLKSLEAFLEIQEAQELGGPTRAAENAYEAWGRVQQVLETVKKEQSAVIEAPGAASTPSSPSSGTDAPVFAVPKLDFGLDQLVADIDAQSDDFEKKIAEMADRGRQIFESVMTPQEMYAVQQAELDELLSLSAISQETYNRQLQEYTSQLNEALPGIQSMAELEQRLTDTFPPQQAELQRVRESMLDLNLAMEAFPEKADQIQQALLLLQQQETELVNKTDETSNKMSEFALQAARNMQDEFADFLFDPFDEGLDGMLKGFGEMIQRMIAEATAAQIMSSLFGDDFLSGKSNDVGGLISQGLSLFSFDGGGYTGNGPRTGGLDGKGGYMALVHPQESIVDHTKGQSMEGAPMPNVTQNIIVSGRPDNRTAKQMANESSRQQRLAAARYGG